MYMRHLLPLLGLPSSYRRLAHRRSRCINNGFGRTTLAFHSLCPSPASLSLCLSACRYSLAGSLSLPWSHLQKRKKSRPNYHVDSQIGSLALSLFLHKADKNMRLALLAVHSDTALAADGFCQRPPTKRTEYHAVNKRASRQRAQLFAVNAFYQLSPIPPTGSVLLCPAFLLVGRVGTDPTSTMSKPAALPLC